MKKNVIALVMLVSLFASAQSQTTPVRTITVYGSATYTPSNLRYKTDVTLSIDNGYYSDNPCTNIEELKAKYFEEIKKLNIDASKFVEDDLTYASTGYRKEGTTFHFETSSKDEILKVVNIRMSQVLPSYVQVKSEINKDEVSLATKEALKDARRNAEMVAKAADQKIDKIYSVSSYELGSQTYWRTISSEPEYIRLTVIYSLKD